MKWCLSMLEMVEHVMISSLKTTLKSLFFMTSQVCWTSGGACPVTPVDVWRTFIIRIQKRPTQPCKPETHEDHCVKGARNRPLFCLSYWCMVYLLWSFINPCSFPFSCIIKYIHIIAYCVSLSWRCGHQNKACFFICLVTNSIQTFTMEAQFF